MTNDAENKTKKYLLVVVEGKSDRTTFEIALRTLVSKYCPEKDIEIDVVKGDTLVLDSKGNIIPYNKEEETVSAQISNKIHDLHLKATDIVSIAMLTDLDACFAEEDFFVEDSTHLKAYYDTSINKCKRINISELIDLRKAKFNVVKTMYKKSHIQVDGYQIKYRLFYLNVDLEWVFYNRLNCTKLEKTTLSENFDSTYGTDENAFTGFINSLPYLGTDYMSSWEPIINKQIKPMDVVTNIRLLIEWIKNI